MRDHRDDLLRQHVERVARVARRLDRALVHAARHGGAGDEIAAVLREDDAFADGARPGGRRGRCAAGRSRPTAALRSARRDRSRPCRCRARATTWRRGRGAGPPSARPRSRRAAARASEPWCARTSGSPASSLSAAASRSARRRLLTKISVERCARISSSRRGWIAVQIDGRVGPCEAGPLGMSIGSPSRAMSSTGTSIVSSQRLRLAGVDDGDRARRRRGGLDSPWAAPADARRAPPRNRATSSSGRCVADSPMRCSGPSASGLEALERQRQVRAALGRHQRVDLVDDHGDRGAQRLARVRGEQQVQRLGRRDEDVGRLRGEARALGRRRVAGADRDGWASEPARPGVPRPARCRRAAPAGCARRRRPAP